MPPSTTPPADPPSRSLNRTRSKSPLSRSRPTTPLRPSSRSSLRDSATRGRGPYNASANPIEDLQDGFAELSDAMADLEQNFLQLQVMHESLSRFSESFAGFLYGLNMNAFCVDFSEVSPRSAIQSCTSAQKHAPVSSVSQFDRPPFPSPSNAPRTTPTSPRAFTAAQNPTSKPPSSRPILPSSRTHRAVKWRPSSRTPLRRRRRRRRPGQVGGGAAYRGVAEGEGFQPEAELLGEELGVGLPGGRAGEGLRGRGVEVLLRDC